MPTVGADADTPVYKLDLADFLRSLILSFLFCSLEVLIAPTNGRIKELVSVKYPALSLDNPLPKYVWGGIMASRVLSRPNIFSFNKHFLNTYSVFRASLNNEPEQMNKWCGGRRRSSGWGN